MAYYDGAGKALQLAEAKAQEVEAQLSEAKAEAISHSQERKTPEAWMAEALELGPTQTWLVEAEGNDQVQSQFSDPTPPCGLPRSTCFEKATLGQRLAAKPCCNAHRGSTLLRGAARQVWIVSL